MTAPTNLRGQVDRDATTVAMFMKYSSQEARSAMPVSTKNPNRAKEGFGGDLPKAARCDNHGPPLPHVPLLLVLALTFSAPSTHADSPDGGSAERAQAASATPQQDTDTSPSRPLPSAGPAPKDQAPTEDASAAEVPQPRRHRYFFHGYDYGSQAVFNPLTTFLNRGFDVLQIRGAARNPFEAIREDDVRNVFDNLGHAYARVRQEGGWRFMREEMLPLSWSQHSMRWAPNYTLHLIGGGMTFTALREWYEDHDVPWAGLWSAATLMSSALVNEALENKGSAGRNTDCIADIYFFDLGGILLFSFAPINRFFSETVMVSDWSMQPGLTWPGPALNNQGNYFALKWSIPYIPALRLFGYIGLGSLFGLSYRLPSGLSWSLGGGLRSTRLINQSQVDLANTVDFAASAGLFVDRNESLLASLVVSNVIDYFVSFNLYPNAIIRFEPGLGLWGAVSKNGHFVVGLSAIRTFGLGAGAGSVYR